MQSNYDEYKIVIKSILTDDNICKILKGEFALKFGPEICHEIVKPGDIVSKFLKEFDEIDYPEKYEDFLTATNEISDWIKLFLKNSEEAKNAKRKFTLIFRIFRIQNEDFVNSLMLNEETLNMCLQEELINDQLCDELRASLNNKGEINTKLKFFWNINLKGPDCLWKLLWIYYRIKTKFIPEYLPELNREINLTNSDDEKKSKIKDYCNKILSENSELFEQNVEASNQDDDDNEESDEYCSNPDALAKLYEKITNFQVESDGGEENFQLREYQKELAECGIKEGNAIICAPTGCGKTIVAVKIVEDHLKNNPNGKVAFLVHQVLLAEQQANFLKKCLKCDVICISGGSKKSYTPLIWTLESDNIFVLTADILRNNLELKNENRLKSINTFSLIIFDECHNVDKKHPYNRIMDYYFEEKNKGQPVPKVIGLTASTGTNKAASTQAGLTHIINLCGNLDAYRVSTVQVNKEELDSIQSVPDDEILKPEQRSSDQFEKDLQITMALCERILEDMRREECFNCIPNIKALTKFPEDRFSPKYLNILGKLDTDLYTNTKEKNNQIFVKRISLYLKVFYKALKVNHLFRKIDAIDLIKAELGSINETSNTCVSENLIKSQLQEFIKNPEKGDQLSNPALEILKTQITDQLKSFPDSRIIVFVRDRKHTLILKDIFSSELPSINCEVAMGNEGLTKNEMQETLKYFTEGDIKVLFATTVIEEGQDIPKCNMVIRYGHVTNETSMIQSKGRARASNSKYRVIVPFKMRWQIQKEIANKKRAEIMYKAINEFQKLDEDDKIKQIKSCQSERRSIPDLTDAFSKLSTSSKSDNSIWEFYCKCGKFICTSKDIRLAGTSLYAVVNQECYSSMKLSENKSKNQCQILCASCHDKIGNRQIYQKSYFPNLTITCFDLKHVGNDKIELYKKWSDIPFQITAFSAADFLNFTLKHSLSDQ